MPKHHEFVESRRDRASRTHESAHVVSRRSRSADHWGAAIAGGILVALPAAAGLYRGTLGWMDVVVALIGFAALAVAVNGFARDRPREGA